MGRDFRSGGCDSRICAASVFFPQTRNFTSRVVLSLVPPTWACHGPSTEDRCNVVISIRYSPFSFMQQTPEWVRAVDEPNGFSATLSHPFEGELKIVTLGGGGVGGGN